MIEFNLVLSSKDGPKGCLELAVKYASPEAQEYLKVSRPFDGNIKESIKRIR